MGENKVHSIPIQNLPYESIWLDTFDWDDTFDKYNSYHDCFSMHDPISFDCSFPPTDMFLNNDDTPLDSPYDFLQTQPMIQGDSIFFGDLGYQGIETQQEQQKMVSLGNEYHHNNSNVVMEMENNNGSNNNNINDVVINNITNIINNVGENNSDNNANIIVAGENNNDDDNISNSSLNNNSSKALSKETISKYYYMPITKAAKELNVGLTLLKKRCRELGIRRWPHRKLMSLKTLISNVQEYGKNEGEAELRKVLKLLEEQTKEIEKSPDLEMQVYIKKLRQSCFKANYKKRKLIAATGVGGGGMADQPAPALPPPPNVNNVGAVKVEEEDTVDFEEEDLEMDSLLSHCFSSSSSI